MEVHLKDEVGNESLYYLKLVITNSSQVEDVVEIKQDITIPDVNPEVNEDSLFFGKIKQLNMIGDLRIEFNYYLNTTCMVWTGSNETTQTQNNKSYQSKYEEWVQWLESGST